MATTDEIRDHLETRILQAWKVDRYFQLNEDAFSYYRGEVRGKLVELLDLWDTFDFKTNSERVNVILDWYNGK